MKFTQKLPRTAVAAALLVTMGVSACGSDSQAMTSAACAVLSPAAGSINSAAKSVVTLVAENPEAAAEGVASATKAVKDVQGKLPGNLSNRFGDIVAILEDLEEVAQDAAAGIDLSEEQVAQYNTQIDEATEALVENCD